MGGIGKTTLANAVFNGISSQFEGSYFIQNVREESEKRGLIQLQEKILSTILGDEHHNIRHASTIERLRRKNVLLVFDDITHLNQINELIGDLENLGSGSKIIITTRDKQVLVSCRVDNAAIYEVKELYGVESFRLFRQHAFKQDHRINEEYMALSNRVISYSKGVPLALKVLGCCLLDRGKHEWESTLEKLKNCPHQDIQTVLKINYDGLDDEEKNLFLDFACFFNGWDEHVVRKFSSSIGLRVLIDKALISISWRTIRVHDLLQEMGLEIVRQESVNRPGQRSRLWCDHDVYDVLKNNKGTDNIQGLCFDMSKMREIYLNPRAFSEMDYLRVLIVNYTGNNNKVHGFGGLEFDFAKLRCLYWDSYPFTSLPLKFYPQNLVVLKMRKNNLEQLCFGIKDLANIKYIDMSYSNHLLKVPDLSEAQNLECLILENCASLFEITAPSQNLDKLVYLNLRNCESLINLPIGIQSKSLRNVILSGCSSLNTAPRISCNMERLCLDGTAIKELSSCIDYPSRLVELNLNGCLELESLPSSVCNLNSLQYLNLTGLSNLKFVLGIPPNIKELYLDGTAIKELLSSIENASSLVRLSLKDCSSLESLSNGICKLKYLEYLCISGCLKLDRLPEDIGDLESLEVLEAHGINIREVPSSMGRLKNLHDLSFVGCKGQEMVCSLSPIFPRLRFLRRLNLNHCSLTELPNNLGELSSLIDLKLDGNNFESLPTSIVNLSVLYLLSIRFCNRLQSLPMLQGNVHEIKADGCKLLKVLSGLKIPSNGYCYETLSFINCFNLDWNAGGKILNDALLKKYSARTVRFEEMSYSSTPFMIFPGIEIPEWFDIQSNGSRIELPHGSFNHKLLGFVCCAIVRNKGYVSSGKTVTTLVGYLLHLKSQNGINPIEFPIVVSVDLDSNSDHAFVWYNFNTPKFREFNCNAEATINFFSIPGSYVIKKCGVRLLYSEEFEEPMKRSRCSIIDEAEAHFKKLKPSNFFKGESSSSLEVEELSPLANESISFSFDLNELPQDFVESTMDVITTTPPSPVDNDGAGPSGSGCFYDEDERRPKEFKFF